MKTVLVTGATGTLAPFLLHRLLHEAKEQEFVCLVRSDAGPGRLQRRIATICPGCPEKVEPPRVRFLRGEVAEEIRHDGPLAAVWHFASDLRMDPETRDAVYATNLGGTGRVLDLCRKTGAMLFHVSTAYVCGTRSGVVREDELSLRHTFRNAYEASKAEAEALVREHLAGGAAGAIFRPSIVLGDTHTGVSLTFNGFYKVLWAAMRLEKRLSGVAGILLGGRSKEITLTLPCASLDDGINLVAAEYVTDLLVRLHGDARAQGKTFHLVNPVPPTIGQLMDVLTKFVGIHGVRLVPESEGAEQDMAAGVRALSSYVGNQMMAYFPYIADNHATFDMGHVAELCGGVPPHPTLDDEAWRRLLRYAVDRDFAAVD